MLKAFSKLQEPNVAVILIIGAEGIGKADFAKSILSNEAQVPLQVKVRTATSLPLPEVENRPRIDYVVFMVGLTNRAGFAAMKQNLQFLDPAFFVGKVCFVVTEVSEYQHRSISPAAVSQLALSHCSPMITCDMKNEVDRLYVARMVVTNVEISVGLRGGPETNMAIAAERLKAALAAKGILEEEEEPLSESRSFT